MFVICVKVTPFFYRDGVIQLGAVRTTRHKVMEVRIAENGVGLLPLGRCSLRRPTKQRGNRRFVLNPRVTHLAPFQDRSQLFRQRSDEEVKDVY